MSEEEKLLQRLARRLLATPHKPRDESNIGKPIRKVAKCPKRKKKPSS